MSKFEFRNREVKILSYIMSTNGMRPDPEKSAALHSARKGDTYTHCLRLRFELKTDHKPLVGLLGEQALELLPPWIQRLRMPPIRYS